MIIINHNLKKHHLSALRQEGAMTLENPCLPVGKQATDFASHWIKESLAS